MRLSSVLSLAAIAQSASAHYIFKSLITGQRITDAAVRMPLNGSPLLDVTSNDIRCNANPDAASVTVSVAARATIGFQVPTDYRVSHPGPAAIYLGKAPGSVDRWDGSGAHWFKIAEWGATLEPSFSFTSFNQTQLTTTIPADTPPGEYLVRIEQIGLQDPGAPQWYISCAQIKVTGRGNGKPEMVTIPGYVSSDDPGLTVDIHNRVNTYSVPGPRPWRG